MEKARKHYNKLGMSKEEKQVAMERLKVTREWLDRSRRGNRCIL